MRLKIYKVVIIVYENIVREYDNALLLKAEFERRGYKVRLVHKVFDILWMPVSAIIILPNCYNTEDFETYTYFLNSRKSIYFNLQYEQVISERIRKIGYHFPKGKARHIYDFCWGREWYQQLSDDGMDSKYLSISGALHLDFMRPEFAFFYLTRKEIAQKYHLKEDKKWLLYISGFTYVENSSIEKYTAHEFKDDEYIDRFSRLSAESQKKTLVWFEKLVTDHKEIIIIYRKHPMESGSVLLEQLFKKYPKQIFNISELSVKQWIKVCDIITTWISTSAAEVYMSGKPLYLLRPYPIEKEFDAPFYYHSDQINSYTQLGKILRENDKSAGFPVPETVLLSYYKIDEKPAYVKIAERIERIVRLSGTQSYCESGFWLKRCKFLVGKNIFLKYVVKKIYQFLYFYFGLKLTNKDIRKKYMISAWEEDIKNRKDLFNQKKYEVLKRIVENKR